MEGWKKYDSVYFFWHIFSKWKIPNLNPGFSAFLLNIKKGNFDPICEYSSNMIMNHNLW